MNLVCPGCGIIGSIEVFTTDADARAFAGLCAALPAQLGPIVIRYMGLFRPTKRALTWRRARKLLEELAPLIQAGEMRKRGRDWKVPVEAWGAAIQQMLDMGDKLQRPMPNNNYLFEILVGTADRMESKAEQEQLEKARKHATPADVSADPKPIAIPRETVEERMVRMRREQEERDRQRGNVR